MKKTLLLITAMFITATSFGQVSDFVSGIDTPGRMILDGNTIYVAGETSISIVDITSPNPAATPIFSVDQNQYLSNFTKSDNFLYVAVETIANDDFLESSILMIDLSNVNGSPELLIDGLGYVAALTVSGDKLYFSAEVEAGDDFTTYLHEVDLTQAIPSSGIIVGGLANVQDILIRGNYLYVSDIDAQTIFRVDVTSFNPSLQVFSNDLNFNRGIFLHNDELYVADGNEVKKGSFSSGIPAAMTTLGSNMTYFDSNGGTQFYANFRDVVASGNMMYLSLENQGMIVSMVDTTLSAPENQIGAVRFSNSGGLITIDGLNASENFSIYSTTGQRVIRSVVGPANNTLDISFLQSGVYLLKSESGSVFKFIR